MCWDNGVVAFKKETVGKHQAAVRMQGHKRYAKDD
jgi:hypothetical protein